MKTVTIHNVETGEITEREMTSDEAAQFLANQKEVEKLEKAEAAKAGEKAALLAKLGITEDEAKLLLS
jgi:hypothetical protein